ncbi:MAG: peptidoglycan DD-metalloendopeptidase family protein [Bacilli bacterium]
MNHEDDNNKQRSADTQTGQALDDAAKKRGWRALFAKRWAFPALYLTAAALIIALMYGQANRLINPGKTTAAAPKSTTPAVTVTAASWTWPIATDATGVRVMRGYYDMNAKGATVATLASDLVHYDNGYQGSTGYDLGEQNGRQAFGVVAATAGDVTDVRNSPVMGQTVVVSSANGYSELYQSLGAVDVKTGQHVLQGQEIGSSGYNQKEASLGNHLFFAVEKNGAPVDPGTVLPKP